MYERKTYTTTANALLHKYVLQARVIVSAVCAMQQKLIIHVGGGELSV